MIEPVNKALSDKMQDEGLNITLRSMVLDDHGTKYPTLYATGVDFTMAFDAPWYKMTSLRDSGSLVPLESLVDQYGPVTKQHVGEKVYYFNFSPDKHLYGIPAGGAYGSTIGVVLREDLRLKYGAPAPDSSVGVASLEPFLQAIKDNEPNMIPLAVTSGATGYSVGGMTLQAYHKWLPGGSGACPGLCFPDVFAAPKYDNDETLQEWQDNTKLCHEWWKEGLINKEDLTGNTVTEGIGTTIFATGRAAAWLENEPDWKYVEFGKMLNANYPDAQAMGYDLTGIRSGKGKTLGLLKQWNFIVFNAGAPTEQQVAGIQFFNWLHGSQDNMDLWLMGIEGVNYKKEPNMRFSEIEGVDATRNYRRQPYVGGCGLQVQRHPIDLPQYAMDTFIHRTTESNFDFNPYEAFEPSTKEVEVELATLAGLYQEAIYGIKTGQKPPEESMPFYTQTLDGGGRQDVKAKLQAQFDEWLAANPV
ncbi:MAG: DUF3502 domain-containing protein [Chloroflexi bacterium]|nr:DUF3502 domain-containing protein [Chloroflexota bacterium]